jgi:poly(A) polymerase
MAVERSTGGALALHPWPAEFHPRPACSAYFVGVSRTAVPPLEPGAPPRPPASFDLRAAVEDFRLRVYSYQYREEGMECVIRHMKAKDLPDWALQPRKAAVEPAEAELLPADAVPAPAEAGGGAAKRPREDGEEGQEGQGPAKEQVRLDALAASDSDATRHRGAAGMTQTPALSGTDHRRDLTLACSPRSLTVVQST